MDIDIIKAIEIIKAYRDMLINPPSKIYDEDIKAFNIALSCMEKVEEYQRTFIKKEET